MHVCREQEPARHTCAKLHGTRACGKQGDLANDGGQFQRAHVCEFADQRILRLLLLIHLQPHSAALLC